MTERAAGSLGLWVGAEGRWVCTDEGRLHNATLSLLSLLSVLVGFGEHFVGHGAGVRGRPSGRKW